MRPPGLEPGTTASKAVMISVSPRTQFLRVGIPPRPVVSQRLYYWGPRNPACRQAGTRTPIHTSDFIEKFKDSTFYPYEPSSQSLKANVRTIQGSALNGTPWHPEHPPPHPEACPKNPAFPLPLRYLELRNSCFSHDRVQ